MRRLLRIVEILFKSEKLGNKLNPNTYPNNVWYRKCSERNFDVVLLGDTDKVPRIKIPATIKAFDWGLAGQNLEWDFNVIKHFFSILKPNGLVVFPLTDSFITDIGNKVDERKYYLPMMPYIFTKSEIKRTYIRICKYIPILAMMPPKFSLIRREIGFEIAYERVKALISSICHFCEERDLMPCFILISNGNGINTKVSAFEEKRCLVKVLNSMDDYNWNTIEMLMRDSNKNDVNE